MITFVETTEEHIAPLIDNFRVFERTRMEALGGRDFVEKQMASFIESPHAICMTFLDNESGEVAGVFIAISKWQGVAEIWAYLTNYAVEQPLSFHRAADRALAGLYEELSLHRVQATVYDGRSDAHRWLKILGFDEEGVMRKCGPFQEDASLMAKVV